MKLNEINFNDDCSMIVTIPEQEKSIMLTVSDSLMAYEEEISITYKKKIVEFLNLSSIWYSICIDRLRKDIKTGTKYRLMEIFILSEQNSNEMIYGVLFNVDGDREHGRGMKIRGDDLSVIEFGLSEVAYT